MNCTIVLSADYHISLSILVLLNNLSCFWFSAELILQENIDYNDLLNSIQDGNSLSDGVQNGEEATENKDVVVQSGEFFAYCYFIFVVWFSVFED